MDDWRIRQRYGFGAGNVALRPSLHLRPEGPDGFFEGIRRVAYEARLEKGTPLHRLLLSTPVILASLLFLSVLLLSVLREPVDHSDIQIVMLTTPPPEPVPQPVHEETPIYEPAPIEVEEPPPPAPKVARAEPPPPKPVVKPQPPRPVAKPKPQPKPKIEFAATPPPVVPKVERQVRREAKPRPKPKVRVDPVPAVKLDAVAMAEPEIPEPTRTRRQLEAPRPDRQERPSVAPLVAAAPVPTTPREIPTPRATRVVAERPDASRPRSELKPLPAVAPTPVAAVPEPVRTARAAPQHAAPERHAPRPAVQPMAAPSLAEADRSQPTRQRMAFNAADERTARARPTEGLKPIAGARAVPVDDPTPVARASRPMVAPSTDDRRAAPDIPDDALARLPATRVADPATAGRASRQAVAPTAPTHERRSASATALGAPSAVGGRTPATVASVGRGERIDAPAAMPDGDYANAGDSMSGVPLGSLAACMSDRQEDSLKQRVVAAVTTQRECISAAGTYRFVETKNLNAFLMWIERAPHRGEADRCEELRLALECLAQGGGR